MANFIGIIISLVAGFALGVCGLKVVNVASGEWSAIVMIVFINVIHRIGVVCGRKEK